MLKTESLRSPVARYAAPRHRADTNFPGLQELYSHAEPKQLLDFSKGVDRFAPRTFEESIVAVYSTWNLLDRMVLTPGIHIVPWAFGMFLPVQVEKLVRFVRLQGVRTYCEVGFNGGHTAAAVLSATRDVTVRSFDIGEYGEHTSRNAKWLAQIYPKRFNFTLGDSRTTIPQLSRRIANGVEPSCDIILVDGSHEEMPTYQDLTHFRRAASPGAIVITDDLDSPAASAVLRAYEEGWFIVRSWYIYHQNIKKPKIETPCRRCFKDLPNLTVVHDPNREVMPCMRWVKKGCINQIEERGQWDTLFCSRCDNGGAWGFGQYLSRRAE